MEKFIVEAMYQADKATDHKVKYRHGAVVFDKKGNILSKGYNCKRVVPELRKYGYQYLFHHAESNAILKADRESLTGSTLLVIRKGVTKLCNSKPCSCCMSLIYDAGIRKVFYSDTDGTIKEMIM